MVVEGQSAVGIIRIHDDHGTAVSATGIGLYNKTVQEIGEGGIVQEFQGITFGEFCAELIRQTYAQLRWHGVAQHGHTVFEVGDEIRLPADGCRKGQYFRI